MNDNLINYKSKAINTFLNTIRKNRCFELTQVISIDEIELFLNLNLEALYYIDMPPNSNRSGYYNIQSRKAYISSSLDSNSSLFTLIHELLHVLSRNSNNILGLLYIDRKKEYGRYINEGMTDFLAEKITGLKKSGGIYEIPKKTYGILSAIIPSEYFIKDFIYGTNEVEKKFADKFSTNVALLYKSIVSLLDIFGTSKESYLTFSDNSDLVIKSLNTCSAAKEALDNNLGRLINLALQIEDDPLKLSLLLERIQEYPGYDNFKEFNFEEEKIRITNEVNAFLDELLGKSSDVAIPNIKNLEENEGEER